MAAVGDYVADAPQRTLSGDEVWHVDGTSFDFADISRIEFTFTDFSVTQDVEIEAYNTTYIQDRVDAGFSMLFYSPIPEPSSAFLVIASSLTLILAARPKSERQ